MNSATVYSEPCQTDAERHELAKSLHCTVLADNESTLLLDLDSAEAVETFKHMWYLLCDVIGDIALQGSSATWLKSRSGNTHVVLRLYRPMYDPYMRLLYQTMLGSDPKRTAYTIENMRNGSGNPNILFRPINPDPEAF